MNRFLALLAVATSLAFAGCGGTAATGGPSQAKSLKPLTVFVGPTAIWDSVWMADDQGYFKQEGLQVTLRTFTAGAIALQTFRTGQGDVVLNGDLPGITYWSNSQKDYTVIAVVERDAGSLGIIANKSVTTASDLKGKAIATKVGSSGSFFIYKYLHDNGMSQSDVTIKDLAPQDEVTALCQGDISAFFIWSPFTQRALQICPDKVHQIASQQEQYDFAAVRPGWLKSHQQEATAFIRAIKKGADYAKGHLAEVQKYGQDKYGVTPDVTKFQWGIQQRPITFDSAAYSFVSAMASWAQGDKLMSEPLQLSSFFSPGPLKAAGLKVAPIPGG